VRQSRRLAPVRIPALPAPMCVLPASIESGQGTSASSGNKPSILEPAALTMFFMSPVRTGACLVLCWLLLGCAPSAGDGVAAVVNGYNLTDQELERYYQSQIQDQSEPPSEEQARMMRLNLLSEIIDRQLLLQQAERRGLMAVDQEVDSRLAELRAPFENEEAFLESIRERNITREQLREEIRRSMSVEKLLNREITSRVKVEDAEIREYYEANKPSFALPEQQLHLAQIVVTPTPEAPVPNLLNDDAEDEETAEAKAQMLEERLASGEDFARLAEQYSEDSSASTGGDLGFIPQSALEKTDITIRRVVASLSPGDVSPVIETEGQYRIIKLIAKEPAGQRELSDPRVQQTIRDTLLNRKDQLLKAAFLEVIRADAQIQNFFARRVVASYGVSAD